MRLGISPFASTQSAVEAIATAAIDGGLDTLWLGDGFLLTPDFPGWRGAMESFTTLGWLAGRFPTARIGITAAVLPMRDMAWVAKQANTLQRIAGGGFVLAAAAGFWKHDLEARGVDFRDRGERFREDLLALAEHLNDEDLGPGPVAHEPVPIWLAGAAATMRHSIECGFPFQSSRATPEELAPTAAAFFDGGGTELKHRVRVTFGHSTLDGENVEWHAVSGSVNQLVDELGRFGELGVDDLSIIPGHDDASALETVEVLASDVMPQLP
jgi:alkanesulfonate monooxygenase SsuD/methylene tetrahydromethanopterin reductase-like flavin-dependent oxidoreductase (luciferase family)